MTFPSRHEPDHFYFVTAFIIGWKPLFLQSQYRSIVLDTLDFMRASGRIALFCFVIMPHHLHLILKPLTGTIHNFLQSFGSYTAHKIKQTLVEDNQEELVRFFIANRRTTGGKLSIWQDIQAKNIYSVDYLLQKMEYVHNNPIAKRDTPYQERSDYAFSSACFYDHGVQPLILVDDVRTWI